jgi:anti-sigma regulatory factor (Ser/Thr protein kinase)
MSPDNGVGQNLRRQVAVTHSADVHTVQHVTREVAEALGFEKVSSNELAIVGSELASNIIKYGVRGHVRIEELLSPVLGLCIAAHDHGPPFRNFQLALRDGFSDVGPLDPTTVLRRGGIGAGLGAVKRFSDFVAWEITPSGKRVWATRFLVRPMNDE